ncbi:hypothetical protein V441_16905 [Pseudomonas aeruginosa DHS29]|uniref:Uncharacterized protein n=1 Tax=Pseudomonas aeruginosa TaxID=287 RepID=A0A241XLZ1_PSEAI|nr:hypothetical protein DPADHS01_13065 [Pseudomonas aeruginosa DHS01]AWR41701.1 hypothetical protein CLH63_02735 [Pseudomonas aeruginosa]ESZ82124.1 hypothetical protein V441_16905 [Pseudomonas aeruginosa DHS29]KUI83237.1 hypothetical protein ASV59_08280 [Pseudomonas aeruginosa 0C2E]KRU59865.1 hypothetical protein AN448_08485 [Pseudomonas aeruginosa]
MGVTSLPPQKKMHIAAVGRITINCTPQSRCYYLEVTLTIWILGGQIKQAFPLVNIRHQLNGCGMASLACRLVMQVVNLDGFFCPSLGDRISASGAGLAILLVTAE